MRILIIEDNADILANLYGYLESIGYTVDSARTGFAGLAQAADGEYDAIVLDLMLPGLDGLHLCRMLRRELKRATPVLMLTARDTLEDKVAGLEAGADDYLVKPYQLAELDARLKALVRRARGARLEEVLTFGLLRFNVATFEVTREGRRLELTPTGYKLLRVLMHAAPRVLSREELETELWGDDPPESDSLRTHIHALRQVLDKPFASPMLKTVQGVGYGLADPNAR